MKDYLNKFISYKALIFAICFALAKGGVFFAPIILANYINDIDIYGSFEYVLGVAVLIQVFVNLGFSGAIPYFILKKKEIKFHDFFNRHLFYLLCFAFVTYILYIITLSTLIAAVLSAFLFVLHMQFGISFKTNGNSSTGVVVESFFYISILLFTLIMMMFDVKFELKYLLTFILLIFVIIFLSTLRKINSFNINLPQYYRVFNFTKDLVIFSSTIVLIYTSQRFFIGYFLSNNDVGIYSVIFRMSAVVIVFHQFISTALFKKIYESNSKNLDLFFSFTILIILFSSLLIWGFSSFFSNIIYSSTISEIIIANSDIHLIILGQILFWVVSAQNENIIARENLSFLAFKNSVIIFISVSILFITYCLFYNLNLTVILMFIALLMFIVNLSNYYLLHRNYVKLPFTIFANLFSILLIISITLIN